MARAIWDAIGSRPKILLTATPLQNSLMELYGLVGVALIPGMRHALETALGKPVGLSPQSQITGALGAAILAGRD